VGAVLSGNLETLCRAAIAQAASHTNLDLLLSSTTATAGTRRNVPGSGDGTRSSESGGRANVQDMSLP